MTTKLTKTTHSNDHKDGVYTLTDVRDDATWHPVQGVEDHRTHDGKLLMTINHLDWDEAVRRFNLPN